MVLTVRVELSPHRLQRAIQATKSEGAAPRQSEWLSADDLIETEQEDVLERRGFSRPALMRFARGTRDKIVLAYVREREATEGLRESENGSDCLHSVLFELAERAT